MAIAKPEVMATQFVGSGPAPPAVCAKAAGASKQMPAMANSATKYFLIMCFSLRYKLPLGGGSRHPRAAGLTRDSGSCRNELVSPAHRSAQIDDRKNGEHKRLHERHEN